MTFLFIFQPPPSAPHLEHDEQLYNTKNSQGGKEEKRRIIMKQTAKR